jgi:hypothetical protein
MRSLMIIPMLLLSFLIGPQAEAATSVRKICYYQPIYAGWVILGVSQNPECGYGEPNAYWIGIPEPSGESVCTNSPMPAGWVITGRRTSSTCGPYASNTSYIKVPSATEDVCEYSPVPANYSVISRNIAIIGCEGQSSIFAGKRIKRN